MNISHNQSLGFIAKLMLVLTPLCLFVDPSSNIFLYDVVGFDDERLAYPLSLALTTIIPFVIIAGNNKVSYRLLIFIALPILLSVFHAVNYGSIESLQVAITWMAPFLWLSAFLSINRAPHDRNVVKWFCIGSILSTSYIVIAGTAEIFLYGALQDEGRMSTNFVLPGHYQLYVYMPTMTAFSTVLVVAALRAGLFRLFKFDFLIITALGFTALVYMAAREAILSFIFALAIVFFAKTKVRLFFLSVFVPIVGVLLITYIENITNYAASSEIKSLRKFSQFNEAGQTLGSRDLAVADYFGVFTSFPLFGTGFRSPFKNYFGILTEFPSAHNYYVDTMAWGGISLCILIFPFLIYVFYQSIKKFFSCLEMEGYYIYYRAIFVCLIISILFSNNINVPFRAPLLAPLFGFLMYGLFAGSRFVESRSSDGDT